MELLENEEQFYPGTFTRRPKELEIVGSGDFCCIPLCKNTTLDRDHSKSGIGFFSFPSDQNVRKEWIKIISRYRRKGGKDSFTIKKSTKVCEFHFPINCIKVSLGYGKKSLVKGSVPSIFKFKEQSNKKKRKSPKKRCFEPETVTESDSFTSMSDSEHEVSEGCNEADNENQSVEETCQNCELLQLEINRLKNENEKLQNMLNECENSRQVIEEEKTKLETHVYNYENISKNPTFFKKATGLEKESFDSLFEFLDPGDDGSKLKYYDYAKDVAEQNISVSQKKTSNNTLQKRGPKPKLNSKDQLFMCLSWLKNGFTMSHVTWLFDTPKSTVSRYIITWINFMYFSLGSIPVWPSRQQIDENMPESFKRTYPSTRCVIDCTELHCQRPSSLSIQSSLYSSYKHHVTYKGLIGIAPSGAVTFVSNLYPGSISDKEIVRRSGLLNEKLWDRGDSVMADRGFLISDDLEKVGVSLNIPAFLNGRDQLTKAEVKESQSIASVRIHVERAIQRVKKFHQIRNEIPLILHGSVNQMWTVCALLCNLMPPLILKDTQSEQQNIQGE